MAHTIHGPDEGLIAKAAKKKRKLEVEQQMRRAQGRIGFWKLVKIENPGLIKQLDLDIALLQSRRAKYAKQLEIADAQCAAFEGLVQNLAVKVSVQKPVEKQVNKYLRLLEKVAKYEKELAAFTPEQLELLKQASKLGSNALG